MDKRKFNGGNSTKAKGIDKRKNNYKNAIEDASTIEDVVKVLRSVKKQALDGDLQASKLFLSYYLGNPTSSTDITTNGNDINISPIEWVG